MAVTMAHPLIVSQMAVLLALTKGAISAFLCFFLLLLFRFLAFFHSLSLFFRRATTMHKCLNQMPDMVPPGRTDSPGQLWAVPQGSCNAEFHPLHQQLLQFLPCPHRSDLSHVPLRSCHLCHGVKNLGLMTMLVLLLLSCVGMANHSTSLCLPLEVTNGGPLLATWLSWQASLKN